MTGTAYGTVRAAIKTALDNITGLKNFAEEPDAIPAAPFSVLGQGEIDYDTDFGGGHDIKFRLFVAMAEVTSKVTADAMDAYLADTGSKSIRTVLNAVSVTGGFVSVTRVEHIGQVDYRGRRFYGAEFLLSVECGG